MANYITDRNFRNKHRPNTKEGWGGGNTAFLADQAPPRDSGLPPGTVGVPRAPFDPSKDPPVESPWGGVGPETSIFTNRRPEWMNQGSALAVSPAIIEMAKRLARQGQGGRQ